MSLRGSSCTGGTSEVSAAFYTPLHCLELGLRNALHARLCVRSIASTGGLPHH